jgi:DNA-binding MarR family transcriptional regulator
MSQEGKPPESATASAAIYDVSANDPDSTLIDRSDVSAADLAQISEVMRALGAVRSAEDRMAEASQKYMKLGRTDMKALHFLIVSENQGAVTTAGAIAAHLEISSASTTKLLDRLQRGGHITRSPHPTDRRALAIRITPETRRAAYETVGPQQARRFHAAARLTPQEREIVIRFLQDMARELGDPSTSEH